MVDPLNIALSVDALGPRLTGIGRYCLELARGVPAVPDVSAVRYFRGSVWLDDPEAVLAEGWAPPRSGRVQRKLLQWGQRRFARSAVVHGPNFFLPDWADTGVITVHDLSVLLYPETHPAERVRDFERRLPSSLARANHIITDSQSVRTELIAQLGLPEEQVHAIPLAPRPCQGSADPALLLPLELQQDEYTLCVSTFEPRKRIDALVRAYGRIDPALRRSVPLVLVGANGWRNDDLNALIASAVEEGWVRRFDFVPDRLLASLYAGARLFVYPSRYEGFGLPPIEAMQYGVPTVVGDATTLIEVTMGAAIIANPDDEVAFSDILAEALENREWQAKAALAGRTVAGSYSWPECVAATVAVYRKASRA